MKCVITALAIAVAILCVSVVHATPKAIIDLGSPDVATLMTHIQGGDGDTTSAAVGGLTCRRNLDPANDAYFYFGIDNSFAYQGSRPTMYITFHYYDTGTATLNLQYDSTSDAYKSAGSITLTNTNAWKCKGFRVTDGYFGNRQNGGADFRIAAPGGATFYIDMVYARDFCGPNPRVRIHPPPGRPNMSAAATRALMENWSQWPVLRGQTQVFGDYDHSMDNFTDAELSGFYTGLKAANISITEETGAITQNGGEEAFNGNKHLYDRILSNGGANLSLVMQEPLTVARYNNWGNEFAANETVDWIQLVRQNYSDVQIASIEAYPYNSYSLLQWWITALQDRCAQRGVEGIDYFEIDCDWRIFPSQGNWATVKNLENWCHSNGLAYSVIYWPCPHASSMNDADFWTDINNEGTQYKNAGGTPDEYDIQCWDYIPLTTVPETTANTFANGALRFINAYVPRVQTTYNGAIPLPGTVQAENFDRGGENVAYHDLSLGNTGAAYRIDESVDLEESSGGVRDIGWIETGEWLEYTVNVASAGTYNFEVRVASPNTGCTFHIEINGTNVTGSQTIPNTTDWHTWATKTITGISLSAGQQVMRMAVDTGGWNFDYVYVRSAAAGIDPVTNFSAIPGSGQVALSWTNSSDARFVGTMIRYKTTGYPTNVSDGTLLANRTNNPGTTDSYTHTGTSSSVTYFYSAFAYDSVPNYAAAAHANTPPPAVSSFAALASQSSITLSWQNPSGINYTGAMIRYKMSGYPTGVTDGLLAVDEPGPPGGADGFTHTGLMTGATYYYRIFAHDAGGNYNTLFTVTASATTDSPTLWLRETFDTYSGGNVGGQGNWSAAAADSQVESSFVSGAGGRAILLDSIAAAGTVSNSYSGFVKKTSGTQAISFDVSQTWAGTSSTTIFGSLCVYGDDSAIEIARFGSTSGQWRLEYGNGNVSVLESTVTQNTWYTIKLVFDLAQRKISAYVNGVSKASNLSFKTNSGTNIARISPSSGLVSGLTTQQMYFDNIVGETYPAAPASVTDDGAYTGSLSKLHCSWTSGGASAVEYKYAIGTTPGGTNMVGWTTIGSATEITRNDLVLAENRTYYFAIESGNGLGTWSSPVNSNGIKTPATAIGIQAAKALADGGATNVYAIRGKKASAAFQGYFYIQEPNGHYGLKALSPASAAAGCVVDVAGVMKGSGAERYIDCTGNAAAVTVPSPLALLDPVCMDNASVGGADLFANAPGVVGAAGPNNIGLLVTIWGRVTQRDIVGSAYFYIDDGCALRDGTTTGGAENVGVRIAGDPTAYPAGSYLYVTGISSCFSDGGLKRRLLPATVHLLH